jgi:hypothetical protein
MSPETIVATVNGESIPVAELRHWMLLHKAEVYGKFYRLRGVKEKTNDFWTSRTAGEIPLDILKQYALKSAIRFKMQQILTIQSGFGIPIQYDDLMIEMSKVNKERKKQVENGQVVYGIFQYTPRTYLDHVKDLMVRELKNYLLENDLKPNDSKLRSMYHENLVDEEPATFEQAKGFLRMQYVDRNYDGFIDSILDMADVQINHCQLDKVGID